MRQIIGYIIVGSGIIFTITILCTFISSIYRYLTNPLTANPENKCIGIILALAVTILSSLFVGWAFMKIMNIM